MNKKTVSRKSVTKDSQESELVSSFKYLGFLLDDNLSFKEHIQYVAKKLKVLLGFYCKNKSKDSVYHGALRFITNCGFLTQHCISYSKVRWTSLSTHQLAHLYVFIYKAILSP